MAVVALGLDGHPKALREGSISNWTSNSVNFPIADHRSGEDTFCLRVAFLGGVTHAQTRSSRREPRYVTRPLPGDGDDDSGLGSCRADSDGDGCIAVREVSR